MKTVSVSSLLPLGIGWVTLYLNCLAYASLAWGGAPLPASPFVRGVGLQTRLLLSGSASVLFLVLVLPVIFAPPSGGARIRLVFLVIATALSLDHLRIQFQFYSKHEVPPLWISGTLLSVGGELVMLMLVWSVWLVVRRSNHVPSHLALGWLASFYFVCIGGTPFVYGSGNSESFWRWLTSAWS